MESEWWREKSLGEEREKVRMGLRGEESGCERMKRKTGRLQLEERRKERI